MGLISKKNFIEHSLRNIITFFEGVFFNDEYVKKNGMLQRIPALIKMLVFLFIIIFISFTRSIPVFFVIFCVCLFLALISKINILFFMKRVWIFMSLFAFLIGMPAIFGIFTPGDVLLRFSVFGAAFTVTHQGVFAALTFILRVGCSVSLVVLLVLTTAHEKLLKTLKQLGMPVIFVHTLNMCYRYIHVLIKEAENFYYSLKSRRISDKNRYGKDIVGFRIAVLWHKSKMASEEIYLAMLSRGYRLWEK